MTLGRVVLAQDARVITPADVEVPEKSERELGPCPTPSRREITDDPFARQFGAPVRTDRILGAFLGHRHHARRRVTIRGATGREDETFHPVLRAVSQQVNQARDVCLVVVDRFRHRLAHVRQRRKVHHGVEAGRPEDPRERGRTSQVALDELQPVVGAQAQQTQRLAVASVQVVEHDYPVTVAKKSLHGVGADVPGPARHEYGHGGCVFQRGSWHHRNSVCGPWGSVIESRACVRWRAHGYSDQSLRPGRG